MRPEQKLQFETFAMPRGGQDGASAVYVSIAYGGFSHHLRLDVDQAERVWVRLGTALSTLRLGDAYALGADPRDQERLYRAKLAVRLGLTDSDVRAVFDLSEVQHARLVAEVRT